MKNKKTVLAFVFILAIIAVFGFKILMDNSNVSAEITQVEQSSPDEDEKVKVTFVELGSKGCVPCDKMQPILEEIAEEYKGQVEVIFYDLKTPLGKIYVQKYKVRAIPTQVFLDKDGNEYFRHLGFFSKEEVIKVLQQQGVK